MCPRITAGTLTNSKNHSSKKLLVWTWIVLAVSVSGLLNAVEIGFCGDSVKIFDGMQDFLLKSKEELEKHSFIIYIINFNDFMCMNCLNSFLEFYHVLPPPFQQDRALGILVVNHQEQEKNRSRSQKIIKKKLSGFMQANQIVFPIFIDSSGSFNYLSESGTAVVVFSQSSDKARTYTFPISAQEREEIFKTLFQPE